MMKNKLVHLILAKRMRSWRFNKNNEKVGVKI